MEVKHFIGIDVSKSTLDISVVVASKVVAYRRIVNRVKEIKTSIAALLEETNATTEDTLFCMEYTGIYNLPLLTWLQSIQAKIWLESAVQISKSSGITRGKNDKADSARIALYASANMHRMKLWKTPRPIVHQLSALLSQRNRLMKAKKILQTALKEQQLFIDKAIVRKLEQFNHKPLAVLDKEIKAIEKEIIKTIKEDEAFSRMFQIIMSIDGIGFVTAAYVLVTTNEFINIDEGKKYACYAGVVPFEHSSGSSYKGKTRVSHRANKTIKTLLHMSALAAIRMEGDIKEYYLRKVREGKNKMSVLNAVRNKLVLRIFSCIKQNRMFEKKYSYSLV